MLAEEGKEFLAIGSQNSWLQGKELMGYSGTAQGLNPAYCNLFYSLNFLSRKKVKAMGYISSGEEQQQGPGKLCRARLSCLELHCLQPILCQT